MRCCHNAKARAALLIPERRPVFYCGYPSCLRGQGTAHEAEKEPHAVSRILLGFNNQLSVRREMRGSDKGDTVPAGCPGPSVIANHQGTIRSAEHTAMSGARNMTAPFQNRVFFRFGIRA